jgi:UDP-2,3-diacylglucosamine pyrophosphatase LpxH
MTNLRHICVSDLHLGAAYSLLTHIDDDGRVVPDVPGHTLVALAAALRLTVSRMAGDEPPVLMLMGDVLDMGLSSAGYCSRAFLRFIDALFPAGEPAVFSTRLICIPGNHDHHLWRMAQDEQFIAGIGTTPEAGLAGDIVKLTPLLAEPSLPCALLTRLMQTRAHLADAEVVIAYPNLGLLSADGTRDVVLHHGHFIDSLYRAMSRVNAWLAGTRNPPRTVSVLETQNGPWIDFLWSDLGSAGLIGREAMTLYETLLDAGAAHDFASTISDRLMSDIGRSYGVRSDTVVAHGVTVGQLLRALIDLTIGKAAESQRDGYRTVLTADEVADLSWYVGGPVATQFAHEGHPALPSELSFIFGHTHKPFQDQLDIKPFGEPVSVYNSGGWVMDQPTMMACQGGAAILIDDALNVASLRLFNDPVNGHIAPVSAEGIGGHLDVLNPLLAAARAAVAAESSSWAHFGDVAAAAIEKRAELRLEDFFDGAHAPKLPLRAGVAA